MEAMKPSLSSSSSTLRPTMPVGTRLLRTTTTPFVTAARRGIDRRLVHVAVADAGDDDALGAARDRGVDQIRRHVLGRKDDIHARQLVDFADVELGFRRVLPGRVVVVGVLAVAGEADDAAQRAT